MAAEQQAAQSTRQPVEVQTYFRLIYRSHSLIPATGRRAALGHLFSKARSNNKRVNVTGALLVTDHYFVQALEGDEAAVRALYESISRDPLHENVTLIDAQPVDHRVFSRWAMAEVSKDGTADIPLISDRDHGGITAAAPHPSTREQDEVLRAMRNSIGADTV